MRVLLDTNIVLDYLGANHGFTEDADKVFDLAARRKDIKLVSSSDLPVNGLNRPVRQTALIFPVSSQLLNHNERINDRLLVFNEEVAEVFKNRLAAYLVGADNSIYLTGGVYRISGVSRIE